MLAKSAGSMTHWGPTEAGSMQPAPQMSSEAGDGAPSTDVAISQRL